MVLISHHQTGILIRCILFTIRIGSIYWSGCFGADISLATGNKSVLILVVFNTHPHINIGYHRENQKMACYHRKKCTGISLIVFGATAVLIGLIIAQAIPNLIRKVLRERSCVTSKDSSGYEEWVSLIFSSYI